MSAEWWNPTGFYQRDGVTLRLKASYDNGTNEYVLV